MTTMFASRRTLPIRFSVASASLLLMLALGLFGSAPAAAQTSRPSAKPEPRVDAKWLDRLPDRDRRIIEYNLNYAPPAFREDLTWHGAALPDAMKTWDGLHGKVVVLQSWTSGSSAARGIPMRLQRTMDQLKKMNVPNLDDVVLIAVHTPESADKAELFLSRRELPVPVLLDPSGAFLDRLGIYDRPTNVLVDRTGAARFAGLKLSSLPDAIAHLLNEPFDGTTKAATLAEPSEDDAQAAPTPPPSGRFPPIRGDVSGARDLRGQQSPAFYVNEWINQAPGSVQNKVVVFEFWATWCAPCIASIPHLNELAQAFRNDVVVVGISAEQRRAFNDGMAKLRSEGRLRIEDIQYHIGIDPTGQMAEEIGQRSYPHTMVVSSDNIIRWQGHPSQLTSQLMQQIVDANRAMTGQVDDEGETKPEETSGPRVREFLKRWSGK